MSAELELAKLEAKVLAASGIRDYLKRVETIRKLLAAEGADTVRGLILAMRAPTVQAQALAAVLDAYGAGARDALGIVRGMGIDDIARIGRPSSQAKAIVAGLDKAGREAVAAAKLLARAGADIEAVAAPIFAHANRVQGRVTEAVNMAGNEGSTAVADAAGLATVWVAETNACVHCLAYSGQIAKSGKSFPGGLTYGAKSYHPEPLRHPPLHPRCRCTVEPLQSKEYAAALRREADRSVLRGFSLESESPKVRIDAAERLLDRGVKAPASVITYAKRSVKAGAFPTQRGGRAKP